MPARRDLLRFMAAGGLLAQVPLRVHADVWQDSFAQAVQRDPWLRGFRSVQRETYDSQATVAGRWPAGLAGTLFRNGPARHEIGNFRYHHWFDGDGMVHAWRLGPAGVRHQGRLVQTRKLLAERAAGRALYPGFGTLPPDPAPVTSADDVNVANISVLPHHGKLLALWEAGSPWEIDADSLATKGLYAFNDDMAGVPFSAHPRVEPDGTLWNFGYVSDGGFIVLWHIDRNGQVVKAGKVDVQPMTFPHDFLVTSRHIVLLLPPLDYTGGRAADFLDAHEWHPDRPTRVMVVDKNDFSRVQWLELPAQWVFHFGNAWEDNQGVIHFDGARAPEPSSMLNAFRAVMRGERGDTATFVHHHYQVDTRKGTVAETPMFDTGFQSEFPVIDPRVSTLRNERLVFLCTDDAHRVVHPLLNGVAVFSHAKDHLQTFWYGDNVIPEEHLFVPAPGSRPESDGWVVGTAYDAVADQTRLNVFDVRGIGDGPVATATLDYGLPLGLHGKFSGA
ncbi:MAG: carotenoid oxygenase family protein [Pseudomonadales bacterium]